jgi:hypothetical protein
MSKKDITLFYEDLSDSIMELYNVDRETAYNAIKISDMDSVIKKIGYFVYHDVIEVWANSVWKCYLGHNETK